MAIGRRSKPPVALIAGPTASGKSALALALAKRTRGVIVNADSAQLYAGLALLSAGPTAAEMAEADHRLYACQDPALPCSAADWATKAKAEISEIRGEGRLPILVGGTGLYLRTLLDGIAPVPAIDPKVRQCVRSQTVEQNRAQLQLLDPGAAERLNATDTTRIARALEVVLSTQRPLAEWQRERVGGISAEIDLHPLVLLPQRDWLYHRCDERFLRMFDGGAVDEVKALLALGLDPALPAMRAIGVRQIGAYLAGDLSRDEAVAAGQQATRNYAKRQYTWLAHQPPPEWPRYTECLDKASIEDALVAFSAL